MSDSDTSALLQDGPKDGELIALPGKPDTYVLHREDGAVGTYSRADGIRVGDSRYHLYRWRGWEAPRWWRCPHCGAKGCERCDGLGVASEDVRKLQ